MHTTVFFFFNDTATTEIYTLSLHDALPICIFLEGNFFVDLEPGTPTAPEIEDGDTIPINQTAIPVQLDRKSTRLNSSHANISYAVFCLKKKISNAAKHANNSIVAFHIPKLA